MVFDRTNDGLTKAPELGGCPPKPVFPRGCIAPKMFGLAPNIKGSASNSLNGPNSYWQPGGSGALYNDGNTTAVPMVGLSEDRTINRSSSASIVLLASKFSSIYNGSKMQSKALQVLPCIRC